MPGKSSNYFRFSRSKPDSCGKVNEPVSCILLQIDMKRSSLYVLLLALLAFSVACKKKNDDDPAPAPANGIPAFFNFNLNGTAAADSGLHTPGSTLNFTFNAGDIEGLASYAVIENGATVASATISGTSYSGTYNYTLASTSVPGTRTTLVFRITDLSGQSVTKTYIVKTDEPDNFPCIATGHEWTFDVSLTFSGFPLTFPDGGTMTILSQSGHSYAANLHIVMDLSTLGFGMIDTIINSEFYKTNTYLYSVSTSDSVNFDTIAVMKHNPALNDTCYSNTSVGTVYRIVTAVDLSTTVPEGTFLCDRYEGASLLGVSVESIDRLTQTEGIIQIDADLAGNPLTLKLSGKNF